MKQLTPRQEGIRYLMEKNDWTELRASCHWRAYGLDEAHVTRFYQLSKDGWKLVGTNHADKYIKNKSYW